MPCRTYKEKELLKESDERVRREKELVNTLTALLCKACEALSAFDQDPTRRGLHAIKDLKAWWEKHQKLDEDRARKEALNLERHAKLLMRRSAKQAEINKINLEIQELELSHPDAVLTRSYNEIV